MTKAGIYFKPGKIIVAAKNLGVGMAAFERTADYAGIGRLLVDGVVVGEGTIPRSARWFISWSAPGRTS